MGCDGGLMDNAFKYTADKGIELESVYPYKGHGELLCHYKETSVVFKNTGHTDVKAHS